MYNIPILPLDCV